MNRRFFQTGLSSSILVMIFTLFLSVGLASGVTKSATPATNPQSTGKGRPDGYQRVVGEMRAWDLVKASEVLSELRRKDPALPAWDALEGAIAYLRGDYTESINSLNSALKKSPGDSEWLELRLHVKQSQSALTGFRVSKTPNFAIWHDPRADSILIPYLAETMEAAYKVFGKTLGVHPKSRIRIEVFSDPERFHKASTLTRRDIEKGVVGLTKFNKVMVISPGALQRGYRWLDTAAHEFVHFLITVGTRNKTPIWLHEGIAKYLERKWRGDQFPHLSPLDEALLSRAQEKKSFIPFKRMEPSLIYLKTAEDVQLAYAEGASVVEFIKRRGGDDALPRILRAIRDNSSPEPESPSLPRRPSLVELEATGPPQSASPGLRALFKVELAEFEELWKKDLQRRRLRAFRGVQVRKYQLKATGPINEDGAELATLKNAVARRRTRLADRLWLRGRMKAAWVEYKRALRDEPHSPALLNRLARVELHLGLPEKALRNLKKALEVDPDYGASYVHQGIAYEMKKNWKSARESWQEAIHINPFNPLPHERLYVLYKKADLPKDAQRELESARKLKGS